MRAKSFRAFGFLVISLDLLAYRSGLSEILWAARFSASQQIKMLVAFLAILVVGIGLIGMRKWAAIYFSAPLLCIGLAVCWNSIEQVPFPWNLAWMLEGVSLMLPAVVTVRLWPYLSWRGKVVFLSVLPRLRTGSATALDKGDG